MPIPGWQDCMLPALEALGDGKEAHKNSVIERAARSLKITPVELKEEYSRSRNPIFANRVGWAITDLKFAGLIKSPRRGVFQITEEGRKLLDDRPSQVNVKFLMKNYELYRKSQTKDAKLARSRKTRKIEDVETTIEAGTPEERIEQAAEEIRAALERELLERIHCAPPDFFERLVVDLLEAMGYGVGEHEGRPGDGGVDGKIREDALGLDEVYVQAKRYAPKNSVGSQEIDAFAGALDIKGTNKGVFFTTSTFSPAARRHAEASSKKIVLIDGEELASLMARHSVGVRESEGIALVIEHVKRIDEDYFDLEGGS